MSLKNERVHAAGAATRRVPRRAVVSLRGYSEEERRIIEMYHRILCTTGEGWLPVDCFTDGVRKAIANYLAPHRGTVPGDLAMLFLAAAGLYDYPVYPDDAYNNEVTIPEKRTFVRLLRANQNN